MDSCEFSIFLLIVQPNTVGCDDNTRQYMVVVLRINDISIDELGSIHDLVENLALIYIIILVQ